MTCMTLTNGKQVGIVGHDCNQIAIKCQGLNLVVTCEVMH